TLCPDVSCQLAKAALAPRRLPTRDRAANMSTAAASNAAPNRLSPTPTQSAAGTLTPTPRVAATSREPSAFMTTIDHLPERRFHNSGPLRPETLAAQNGSPAARPGSTVPV